MNLTTDPTTNVGYLSFVDQPGSVYRSIPVDLIEGGQLTIDVDKRGAILGIEFLNIETQLGALKQDLSSIA